MNGETIAGIVADLRRHGIVAADYLADRIEAAWKRQEQCYLDQIRDAVNMIGHERFVKEHPPVGNAAELREALQELYDSGLIPNTPPVICPKTLCAKGFGPSSEWCNACKSEAKAKCKAIFKARAALSAPARNCDKYATADEALKAQQAAFEESNFENGECKLGCPGCDDFPIKCEVRWLFAPAKEGGEA